MNQSTRFRGPIDLRVGRFVVVVVRLGAAEGQQGLVVIGSEVAGASVGKRLQSSFRLVEHSDTPRYPGFPGDRRGPFAAERIARRQASRRLPRATKLPWPARRAETVAFQSRCSRLSSEESKDFPVWDQDRKRW